VSTSAAKPTCCALGTVVLGLQVGDAWAAQQAGEAQRYRHPHYDHHVARHLQEQPDLPYLVQVGLGAGLLIGRRKRSSGLLLCKFSEWSWSQVGAATSAAHALCNPAVQSHTDLRPAPAAPLLHSAHGRPAGLRAIEPTIVEYTQDGGVLMTSADASCPAVAGLLGQERAAGGYLAGLGPAAAQLLGAGRSRGPVLVHGGHGRRGQLAPRALVLIDAATGCRWSLDNSSESQCLPDGNNSLLGACALQGLEGRLVAVAW
jgi:hypothetical protein